MVRIIAALKDQKIVLPLKYYGSDDLRTYRDLNTIADHASLFLRLIQETDIDNLNTMENYLDYLCLRKLSKFQELLPLIKSEAETERKLIQSVISASEEKHRQVTVGMVISFINNHYVEISCTFIGTVGSNPTVSAKEYSFKLNCTLFFIYDIIIINFYFAR